jgi:hypothetical protein
MVMVSAWRAPSARPQRIVVRPPTRWVHWALCRDHDPNQFHSTDPATVWKAQLICADCPVMWECLADVRTWPSDLRDVGMVAGGVYFPPKRQHPSRIRMRRHRKKKIIEGVCHEEPAAAHAQTESVRALPRVSAPVARETLPGGTAT